MLLLLFHAADNLYALDISHIIEVIPIVALRKIPHVPAYVAGVFNYRGTIVPVIDLCHVINGTACRSRFSTRIIMVNHTAKDGGHYRLGLMAERVTETLSRPDIDPNASVGNDSSYLGEMFMDDHGMIQRIHWEHLLSDVQYKSLLAGGNIQKHGASNN